MKKIILGIITIMLAAAIFGCGKTAASSGGGGGNSNNNNNNNNNNTQTFSAEGKVYGVNAENADSYVIKVYDLDGSPRDGLWRPNANGSYKIDGLPLNIVLIVVVEKDALQMKNLAWGTAAGEIKADLTPTSTVAVEVISANATARALLENFDGSVEIDDAVANVQEGVNDYYADTGNSSKLDALIDAANNGASLTETIASDLSDIENAAIETCTLTVDISPVNTGTVSPNSGTFLKGTKVKLQAKGSAVGDTRYFFKNWSGYNVADVINNEITLDDNKTISAEFVEGFVLWHRPTDETDKGQKKEFSPEPLAKNQLRIWTEDDEDLAFHDYEELIYAKNTEVTLTYTPVAYGGRPAPDVKDVVKVGFHGTTEPLEVDEQKRVANWDKVKASRMFPDRYVNGESGHNTTTISMDRNIVIMDFDEANYDTYQLQDIQCVVNGDADEWDSLPEYPLSDDIKQMFINSVKLGKDADNLYVLINYIPTTNNQTLGYRIELGEDIVTLISEGKFDGSQLSRDVTVFGVNGDGAIRLEENHSLTSSAEVNRISHTLEIRVPKTAIDYFRNTETILGRIAINTNIDHRGGSPQRINF
jgi:hypothetical protein